jgi:hypothetical protein
MKHVWFAALVAVVAIGVWEVVDIRSGIVGEDSDDRRGDADSVAPLGLRYTEELIEDGWVNGARTPGADLKPLAHSANSICFLTKVEIKGIQGPEDANSCSIGIDEFTGFWQVTAAVAEGGQSEVRCNARCLVWE